jgi:hypothetical protein
MDSDDDLNALLAGDGDDLDAILKDAGLTNGSDEIDLDALLADIDAEDSGNRTAPSLARAAAAVPAAAAAADTHRAQARSVLSHALAAAAAPEGAAHETAVVASLPAGKSERKPSDMNEDDMLQVRLSPRSLSLLSPSAPLSPPS